MNGNGTETASAKFTGGSVFVKTTTEDYTSQSVTVKGNATLDFSNHGDVEIHSYSKYGVTVVDAPGQLTFNNDGTVLLKGKVLPGDKTAQTNVVGIQGESGTWKVTEKVKELKIDLDGAGVDNDGTSYSTGTKAIAASKVDFDVQAQKFTITMNVDPGVEDDSPGAHTSEEVYGIYADKKSTITIGANTATSITVETGLGKGYGIVSTGGAKVAVAGDANVVIDGTQESVALTVNGEGSTLTLAGKQNQIVGDVRAKEQGALGFVSGNTSVAGAVAVDAASTVTLDKASVELAEGSTMKVEGALASTDGVIVLNDAAAGTLSVASLTDGSTLDAVASGSLNDKLGGDLNAFSEAVSITDGAEGTTLVMKEGLVAGEKTAQLTEEGKIDESTVTAKTNSIMESSLEMAAAMPLAMNRMLTTDLRKRMGDLRTSNGAHGAWARYDGGKLSGDSGLDSEFHTIQVGIDTVATPDAPRVGVAFAYTDGEMDYVRSSSDMQGYSLAGYATWMADNGMFLDTVVRMSKFDNDMTVDGSMKGQMDSLAIGVSAEGGWRVDLSSMFYVEPQAEVVYTYINSDDFTLGEARYEVEGLDSLTGRHDAFGKARKADQELCVLLKEIAQEARREDRQTDAVRDVVPGAHLVLNGVAGPAGGLRAKRRDAVAAECARPEKFGPSVEVGRIFEHDGRVADHRTQDAFDETFGHGRDVLHEVLFQEVAHGVAGARNGLAGGNRNRIGRIDEGDDGLEQVVHDRKLLVGLDVRDDGPVVIFTARCGDGVDRHEGKGVFHETVVEHEIPGGTVMSGRRADRLRGIHCRAAANGNHEIHAFSATEGCSAVNRRHSRIGFDP